jgi:hypothetical protein
VTVTIRACLRGPWLLLALAATTSLAAQDAPPPEREETPSGEVVGELLRQHERLLEETRALRSQIERLARALRERDGGAELPEDLAPVLAGLASDDYAERTAATAAMRRMLVDRMWLLLETPDLDPESRQRMKSILVETSAMIRLTTVAVDLDATQRDALWNLLDTDPMWVLDALGDDPHRITEALRHPPPGHGLANEVVVAALIRDDLRPVPQHVALTEVQDASSPILRAALRSLLGPPPDLPSQLRSMVSSNRDRAASRAVKILAKDPAPDLVGFLLGYLRSAKQFNARLEFTIIETIVGLRATEAAGELLEIARQKRSGVSGGYGWQNVRVKPGDSELVGAAMLLDLDLEDLEIRVKRPWSGDEPSLYGFDEPPRPKNKARAKAYEEIGDAIEQAGPFEAIPGYERPKDTDDD